LYFKNFLPGLGEVGEEVQNRLCNTHILATVVLREEGLSSNQGQSKDVCDVFPSYAAQPLNHNESVINSAKPNKAKGMI
jgi:hypothetical protein